MTTGADDTGGVRILHWSDPHFGTERAVVAEALLALAAAVRPTLVVLSGDITQRARGLQFRAARSFVAQLPSCPLLAVPGNHDLPLFDLPRRLFAPYRRFRAVFGEALEPECVRPGVMALGVDTTRRWRHKHGSLSTRQAARVARRLAEGAGDALRIVVAHHPVQVTGPVDRHNLLRGHAPALPAWSAAGLDLVLGGHIHLPYVRPIAQDHPDVSAGCWTVQAGTAISRRVRAQAPNSVNLIDYRPALRGRDCRCERWDFEARDGCFVRADVQTLALRDRG